MTTARRTAFWKQIGGSELEHLTRTKAGRRLVITVGSIATLTLTGLIVLWPRDAPLPLAATNLIPATVERVVDRPCTSGFPQVCRSVVVSVEGRNATVLVGIVGRVPEVGAGDEVRLTRPGTPDIRPPADQPVHYEFAGFDRLGSILWLAGVLALVAAVVLRSRGVLAIVGVALSLAIVLSFLAPAIVSGGPALLCGLVAALAVMFVTLVMTNGIGIQTLAAALGIAVTLALSCVLALFAVRFTHLDGTIEPALVSLGARSGPVSPVGITLSAILIGALGVLADTGVTQASAVMALRRADPTMDARRLYASAFTIGRDHLSATIHTLVLAYAGTVLPLILLLYSSGAPTITALNTPELAEPIVAAIVGCAALIAAVPLTTGLASVFAARLPTELLADAHHGHSH